MDAPFSFNRSIRIGSRRDRITGDSGALTGRELLGRSRVVRFLAKRLPDKRDGRRIRHSQRRLARTLLLLAGQGRREHSDATELRDDPALRLATSDRAGTAPLGKGGRLPSQPTLSRRVAAWSEKEGVEVLREGLQRLAGWRLKAMGGWRRPKTLVIDIDSLPVEVHGEQPGSAWNGYYHRRVYHPIVAAAGETGDILDLRLREGQVHTADGGLEFVLEVLERAELHLCGKAAVRFDAGYPGEPLMAALEERGTHYVARVRNNAVLKRLALPAMDAAVWDALSNGVPAGEPRTWVCESSYRAGSWSRSRRVVQVVVERPGELIPRSFWLLTSMPSGEMSGEDLLALYRRRGKAEGHLGELMSVVAPALSSTSRRKSHYRGEEIRKREKGVDAFACNQVRLLLAGFGYRIMHVQRAVLERVTGTGWSLRRLAERVLRTPARFTVSGRRITMTTGGAPAHWHMLARDRPDMPSGLPSRVLGAHDMSGFVAHDLSGSEPSPRRLNEPDGDAARGTDEEVRGGLRPVAAKTDHAGACSERSGRDGSDVPALGGSVRGGWSRSPEGQAGGGTGSSPGASRGGGGAGGAVPGRVRGLERAALP